MIRARVVYLNNFICHNRARYSHLKQRAVESGMTHCSDGRSVLAEAFVRLKHFSSMSKYASR